MAKLFFPCNMSSNMSNTAKITSPNSISGILVFLCLGYTKTMENRTNNELPEFISELLSLVSRSILFYSELKSICTLSPKP